MLRYGHHGKQLYAEYQHLKIDQINMLVMLAFSLTELLVWLQTPSIIMGLYYVTFILCFVILMTYFPLMGSVDSSFPNGSVKVFGKKKRMHRWSSD